MTSNRAKIKGPLPTENVSEHYASELNSMFRTLNHFVVHAGEIGRAHESFLRGILDRFMPDNVRLGSGFVASPKWTSRQQDILIYNRDFSTLFEVGDCTVIDYEAFIGAIEVKTNIKSKKAFKETIATQAELKYNFHRRGLYALYTWEGICYETALDSLWDFVRTDPTKNIDFLPHVIYVRGKYFMLSNYRGENGRVEPFHTWHIGEQGITEGQALLGLVSSIWHFGLNTKLPWWLQSWHMSSKIVLDRSKKVQVPSDIRKAIMTD